jgi:hypothetical protein
VQGVTVEEGTTNLLTSNQSHPTNGTTGLGMVGVQATKGVLSQVSSPSWAGGGSAQVVVSNYVSGDDINLATVNPSTGTESTAVAVSPNTTYAFSARVLAPAGVQFGLRIIQWNSSGGVVGDTILQTLTGVGNSVWQTISGVLTTASTTAYVSLRIMFLGNGTFNIDGLQVEQKAYATSWQLPGTARAAEALTVPTAGVFNKGNWTVKLRFTLQTVGAATRLLWYLSIDANNYLALWVSPSGQLVTDGKSNGTYFQIVSATGYITAGNTYFIAVAGNGSTLYLFCNGTQIGTVAYSEPVGTLPTSMGVGGSAAGGTQANGIISDFAIMSRAQTLVEHQAEYSTGLPLAWDIDTTYLLPGNSSLNLPSDRQGVWVSPVQNAAAATDYSSLMVTWLETIPLNTALSCQVRTSADGINWGAWYDQVNGSHASAPANPYSQVRFILQELADSGTPVLSRTTVSYEGPPTVSTIYTGMSVTDRYSFAQLQDYLIICNGADVPKKYDGITVADIVSAPRGGVVCVYRERVFIAQGYTLYYSDPDNVDSWPASNFIDVNPDDGDAIIDLVPLASTLLIVKQHSTYYLSGYGPLSFRVDPAVRTGTISPMGMVDTPYGAFLVNREGVWATDFRKQELLTLKVKDLWNTLNQRILDKSAMFYFSDSLLVSVAGQGSNYNDRLLVYDLIQNAWSVRTNVYASCFAAFWERGQWTYLYGDSRTGNVYQFTDSGDMFTTKIETKHFPAVSEDMEKRLLWVDLFFSGGSNSTTVEVSLVINGAASQAKTITVSAGVENAVYRLFPAAYARTFGIRVQMDNTLSSGATFLGAVIAYYPRTMRPVWVV